jgi:predicted aspartyl protease
MTGLVHATAIFAALAAASGAAADDAPSPPKVCRLGQAASLDLKTMQEGMIALRGAINGHDGYFLVDTGGIGATLGFSSAFQARLKPLRSIFGSALLPGGASLDFGANVGHFTVGPIAYSNMWFYIAPDQMLPSDLAGSLQPHIWDNLDVEIDFVKGKLNLFQQKQCPGQVVYWTHDAVASVPMNLDSFGHIGVEADVDGKPVQAFIDTGAEHSYVTLAAAKTIFGIDAKDPALKPMGSQSLNDMASVKTWRYPFQAINFEGISIRNPDIIIADTGTGANVPPLTIGIGALRQLHLFIAYDEKVLYLTAAEAR